MRSSRDWLLTAVVLASVLVLSPCLHAENAADKATAREVATEGIKLYEAGQYADALDRLKRAQALYDAPVHLLYIARAEANLGQLVDASENYRLLERYSLPKSAPPAWVAAIEDGGKELAALEPRIPKLRIASDPPSLNEPSLTIDGAAVSAAVIGISRPADPGQHHIELSAPGYSSAQADLELSEGESKEITLKLVPAAKAGVSAKASSTTGGVSASTAPDKSGSGVGFLLGLRLGLSVPTGTIAHGVSGSGDATVSDFFKPGSGLELHGGVRIARYFTPVLYVEGEGLAAGSGGSAVKNVSKATAGAIGLGLIVGSAPNKLGGFGEFDLVFADVFSLTAKGSGGKECTATASGGAVRFGGGAVLPVSTWLHVTPFLSASLGRFRHIDTGCLALTGGDISASDQRTHGMIVLGVGGDLVLGSDRGR